MNLSEHDKQTLEIIKASVDGDTYKDLILLINRLQANAEICSNCLACEDDSSLEDVSDQILDRAEMYADGLRETFD